jgi:hypothetical protein
MPAVNLDRPDDNGVVILQSVERINYDECRGDAVRYRHCRRAKSIIARQGIMGKVNAAIPLKLIHRENVERYGQDGQVVYDAHQVSFNAEDGEYIRSNDTVEFGETLLRFKTPLSRDKYGVQTWLCI